MSHPDPEPGVRMTISLLLCFMRASTSSRWSVCGVREKAYKCCKGPFQSGSPCGIFTLTNFYTSVVCWSPVNQHNLKTKNRREEEGCDSEEENWIQKLQWLYACDVIMQTGTVCKKKKKKITQNSNRALMSDLPRVCHPSRGWTVDIHTSPRGQRAGGLWWTDRVSPQWLCPCSAFDKPRRHRTSPHLENTRKCVQVQEYMIIPLYRNIGVHSQCVCTRGFKFPHDTCGWWNWTRTVMESQVKLCSFTEHQHCSILLNNCVCVCVCVSNVQKPWDSKSWFEKMLFTPFLIPLHFPENLQCSSEQKALACTPSEVGTQAWPYGVKIFFSN